MDNSSSMQTPPPGWRMDPRFIECKTKRAPLMMPPSLHERAKAAAAKAGMSFNSWCLQAIEAALKAQAPAQEDVAGQAVVPAATTEGTGSEGGGAEAGSGGEAPAGQPAVPSE